MARIAAAATVVNTTTGNHQAVTAVPGAESQHVFISYDAATVTSFGVLRNLINTALTLLQGQLKP